MGYLSSNTNEVIIDAVLTKQGRQKLASMGSLGIKKFALSDDEIDYTLYNISNPNGSDYYDTAISNMPVLEALPANADALRYKLFTNTSTLTQNVLSLSSVVSYKVNTDGTPKTVIDDHDTYTITVYLNNPGLALPPSITSGVFYLAKLNSQAGRGINDIVFQGKVATSGISSTTQASIYTAQADIANRNATLSNPTMLEAAGSWFTLQIKPTSTVTSTLQFSLLVTVAGSVNATPYEFAIAVNPMAALTVTSG